MNEDEFAEKLIKLIELQNKLLMTYYKICKDNNYFYPVKEEYKEEK